MESNRLPAYLWYPRDFDMDEEVKLMTYEEEGLYRRLLDHQWFHGGIPADLALVARLVPKIPASRFRKCWKAMATKFVADGTGRLVNQKLERVRDESITYRQSKVEAGRKGGLARAARAKDRPVEDIPHGWVQQQRKASNE